MVVMVMVVMRGPKTGSLCSGRQLWSDGSVTLVHAPTIFHRQSRSNL